MGKDERTPSIPLAQAPTNNVYVTRKHGRSFAITDPAGALVCVTLYLKGAFEVIRRLGGEPVYAKTAKARGGKAGSTQEAARPPLAVKCVVGETGASSS